MNCKKYRKMLHLNRPGELLQSERLELEQHLSICDECAKLQKEISRDAEIIKELRRTKVAVPDAPQLTNDILYHIKSLHVDRKIKRSRWSDQLFFQFALPRLRFVLAAFIVIITLGFFAQEVVILRRISKLEKQLAEKPTTPSPLVRESMEVNSFLKNLDHIATIKNDKMLINKQALEILLKSYNELKISNKILLQYLQDHKAEIEGLNEKSINLDKIKEMLKRDKRLRQLIRES